MKNYALILMSLLMVCCTKDDEAKAATVQEAGKTLVVYYSYTNNCHEIVTSLTSQIQADVMRIEPADKTQKYEANGYAIGTALLNAIKAAPNDAASYPAIDPVSITNLSQYQNIIIVTPLWWSQMAAIMQTYLFNYGAQMAGKHVALIVSSHSSGISGVVADAERLVKNVTWMGDALWINASNHSNRASLIANWLPTLNFAESQSTMEKMYITIDGVTQSATLVDNAATQTLVERLKNGAVTVTLNSSGGFEIWGALGFSLPTSNEQICAQPGDIVLYNGSNICMFYGSNSWSYTRLGKIDGLSESELRTFLKAGQNNVTVNLSMNLGITLDESADNSTILSTYDGEACDVKLTRTLQTGSWNTLALPFTLSSLTDTPLAGATLKVLSSSTFADGTLTLNFADATSIEAGKPYLVKVPAIIENPVFENVTLSTVTDPTETTAVDFIPVFGKTTISNMDANSILFLGAGNRLYHPNTLPADVKGLRAFFQLKGEASLARAFSINFGDGEATGIISLKRSKVGTHDYYTLDGLRLQGPPSQRGVYIVNGKKVIIN